VSAPVDRRRLGAWYTPERLVATVVDGIVTPEFVRARTAGGRPLTVLDPACGDGRFLAAVAERVQAFGAAVELHGVDVDPAAVERTRAALPGAIVRCVDALTVDWADQRFDLVIGNPPFLSQLSSVTTRGGASRRGGGPYADAAAEFLALGAEVVDPHGGRLAFVLPQSLLASRDAAAIRDRVDERASMIWSWWTGEQPFDAQVVTCALGFEFGRPGDPGAWAAVVAGRSGVPPLPQVEVEGRLGDRARLNANFRDEYYGLVPAVADHPDGPPLITSGLIDPGRSQWGGRQVTFARQRLERPRVALDRLSPPMQEWARRRLVPKVLVANQTAIVEAVCDPEGEWLPAVPVIGVYPTGAHWEDPPATDRRALTAAAWEIAAVLTSPFASAWIWHRSAGTGLGARSVRLSPTVLAELLWPAGSLRGPVAALQRGEVRVCAGLVDAAYGVTTDADLGSWWSAHLDRIERRS
jgi:SAM-dependent methyltransferase